jgi:hypothetical protein
MAVRQTANNLKAGFCCAFTRGLAAIKQRRNETLFAANRKRATWTHHCEAKSPKAPADSAFKSKTVKSSV